MTPPKYTFSDAEHALINASAIAAAKSVITEHIESCPHGKKLGNALVGVACFAAGAGLLTGATVARLFT